MGQRPLPGAGEPHDLALRPQLPGHPLQPLPLTQGILKQRPLRSVAQQRHRHALRLTHHLLQHALLQLVQIGEPVQIHVLAPEIVALRQPVPQLLEPGPGVHALGMELPVIGGIQQRQIPELVAHGALHILHLLPQSLWRDLVGVELLRQIRQLPQKRRPLGGPSEHLQPAVQLLQRQPHGQQLSAAVQRKLRQTAGPGQHPAAEALEAQHLRITGGRRPQRPAQIHLRLMGDMLRHQQHLRPLAALPGHGLQHPAGLSGPRPSDPYGKHGFLLHLTPSRRGYPPRRPAPAGAGTGIS